LKAYILYLNLIPEIAVIIISYVFFALNDQCKNNNKFFLGFTLFLSFILFINLLFFCLFPHNEEFCPSEKKCCECDCNKENCDCNGHCNSGDGDGCEIIIFILLVFLVIYMIYRFLIYIGHIGRMILLDIFSGIISIIYLFIIFF